MKSASPPFAPLDITADFPKSTPAGVSPVLCSHPFCWQGGCGHGDPKEARNPGSDRDDQFDLDALLHPAGAFTHPAEVVRDPDLTFNEKRAILASWASDACAVEAVPDLRCAPDAGRTVTFDAAMDALRELDRQTEAFRPPRHYRKVLANRIPGVFGRKSRGNGQGSQLD
jgi:hypothetical protein